MPIIRQSCKIDRLNGALYRFQQYFSHISAMTQIIHVFPGFHQYYPGAMKYFAQGNPREKPRGYSVARTQDPGLRVKHFITELRRTINPWSIILYCKVAWKPLFIERCCHI